MKLSIIIPVYKTDKEVFYKCLNSIATQENVDFSDVEVIVVKDDMEDTDYTDYEFHNKDFRYTIYQVPHNLGCGLARQYGISKSCGEWIYFIDSDDMLLTPISLNYILSSTFLYDKDMFTFTMCNEGNGNRIAGYGMVSLYVCLFRRSIIDRYDIRFLPMNCYEDMAFVGSYVYMVGWDRIMERKDFPVYWYRYYQNSTSHCTRNTDKFKISLFVTDMNGVMYIDNKFRMYNKKDQSMYVYAVCRFTREYMKIAAQGIELDMDTKRYVQFCMSTIINEYDEFPVERKLAIISQFPANSELPALTAEDVDSFVNSFRL